MRISLSVLDDALDEVCRRRAIGVVGKIGRIQRLPTDDRQLLCSAQIAEWVIGVITVVIARRRVGQAAVLIVAVISRVTASNPRYGFRRDC